MQNAFKLILSLGMIFSSFFARASASEKEVFHLLERTTLINEGWTFRRENSDQEEIVSLPHDYSISMPMNENLEAESGFLPGGKGVYEKRLVFEEAMKDKRVILEFEGVYMNAEVSVNNRVLGSHPYGYTAFAFDLTDQLIFDGVSENIIRVSVDNPIPSSRWYSGSGIYRDVFLTVTGQQHFERNGIVVTPKDLEENHNAEVSTEVKMDLVNETGESKEITLLAKIIDPEGNEVSASGEIPVQLEGNSRITKTLDLPVKQPLLWKLKEGNQYLLHSELREGDTVLDSVDTRFGYRWTKFDSKKGFFLNGEPVKLQGVCLHHDQGSLGAAAFAGAIDRQLDLLEEMGVNAVRCAHNPADHHFLEECSKRGILVIEEAFDTWSNAKNHNDNDYSSIFNETISEDNRILGGRAEERWCEFDIRAMVRHSRNEPCVILYSIGNEILGNIGGDTSQYPEYARELCAFVNEEDGTRPVTIADNMTLKNNETQIAMDQAVADAGGVIGLNYATAESMDRYHSEHPDWCLFGSETVSAFASRGEYKAKGIDRKNLSISAYGDEHVEWGSTAETSVKNTVSRDYIAGEFVWTGFDYLGEPEPWNGLEPGSVTGKGPLPHSSYFGIIDTAGFVKDSYYFYQSQWRNDITVLHILPDWNKTNIRKSLFGNVRVRIYTNAPSVELFQNGKSLGRKTSETVVSEQGRTMRLFNGSLYPEWECSGKAGALEAVAYDEDGNVLEVQSGRSTVLSNLEVSCLSPEVKIYRDPSSGKELIYVEVSLQDEHYTTVSDADRMVVLQAEGARILSGDCGNPACGERYQSSEGNRIAHSTYHGKVLFILERRIHEGDAHLSLSYEGAETTLVIPAETEEEQVKKSLLGELFDFGGSQ